MTKSDFWRDTQGWKMSLRGTAPNSSDMVEDNTEREVPPYHARV